MQDDDQGIPNEPVEPEGVVAPDDAVAAAGTGSAADPEPVTGSNRRGWLVGGAVAVALVVVVLGALAVSSGDDRAEGEPERSTTSTTVAATVDSGPGATNAEGGVVVGEDTVPRSSSTTVDPGTDPGAGPDAGPDAEGAGGGSSGGGSAGGTSPPASAGDPNSIPTIVTRRVELVSHPTTVFRAPGDAPTCAANRDPFVVVAPGADLVVLRWTTGPANGELPMTRDGDRWSAVLVGPMSQQPRLEVRAIGGTAAGDMSSSAAVTVDLANCP